jgi:Tat protein secretion system quality control protein TatD with DNase activity
MVNRGQTTIKRAWRASDRNEPGELKRIAETLAVLRSTSVECIMAETTANAETVLPRLNGRQVLQTAIE